MVKPIYLFPVLWNVVSPGKYSGSTARPSVQVFARDVKGQSVYLRFPALINYVLNFDVPVDEQLLMGLTDVLGISDIRLSPSNPYAVVVRDPNFIPEATPPELVSWSGALADPNGPLSSLWYFKELAPFKWFRVTHYRKLRDPGFTSSSRAYTSDEQYLYPGDPPQVLGNGPNTSPVVLMWDLECYSPTLEFPSADNLSDQIFMISLVLGQGLSRRALLLTSQPINPELLQDNLTIPVTTIKLDSEKALLERLVTEVQRINPDYLVAYNGDTFDVPYWITRARINKVDWTPLGKLLRVRAQPRRGMISGAFGTEWVWGLRTVGLEWLDLLHYYRKYYPQFKNFRLDTVAKGQLGVGKSEISIPALMQAVTDGDVELLSRGAQYAVVDSLRLMELWDHDHIQELLYNASRSLRATPQALLQSSTSMILNGLVAAIDPGALLLHGPSTPIPATVEATVGIYRQVYGYDYSLLYLQLMSQSSSALIVQLAEALSSGHYRSSDAVPAHSRGQDSSSGAFPAFPRLIVDCFFSGYVDRASISINLNFAMQQLLASKAIITMDSSYLRSYRPLPFPFLTHKETLSGYVAVGKASYLLLEAGQLTAVGTSAICKPKCPWHQANLGSWLSSYLGNPAIVYQISQLPTGTEVNDLILTKKLTQYSPVTDPLVVQYGKPIKKWTVVSYIVTTSGPVLLDRYLATPGLLVDQQYYLNLLLDDIRYLQTLPIYG